jgi:hypothetical protein
MLYCIEQSVFIAKYDLKTGTFKRQKNAGMENISYNKVLAKF